MAALRPGLGGAESRGGDYQPGFQIRERIPYRLDEMPERYDMDDFTAAWK